MGKRVLVADDSVTIQTAFAMVFGGQDVELVPARSFDDALGSARRARPSLVIADIGFGARSGYDLCTALKAEMPTIPVYLLASAHTPFDEARGRQVGADGHFIKPFESQSIIDKVLDAIARGEVAAPAPAAPAPAPAQPARPAAIAAARPVAPAPATTPAGGISFEFEADDEYGEFTIERSGASAKAVPPAPQAPPAPQVVPAPPPAAQLRPSLIPGAARPAPARPAAAAPAPPASSLRVPQPAAPVVVPLAPPPVAQAPVQTRQSGGRTIMGLPAMLPPGSQRPSPAAPTAPASTPRAPSTPFAPPTAPAPVPLAAPASAPTSPVAPPSAPAIVARPAPAPAAPVVPPAASSSSPVSQKVEQKLAQIAAKGPEYEAIAKLSREVIEQVVWEVVPELAELLIRQEIDRLANARNQG
jgi:CheY-like chemotaxis protein